MTGFTIGIDVGGTFTDLVAVDQAGRVTLAKAPTTPEDPSLGLLAGLELLAGTLGLARDELLTHTARIVHGTTVATNALLERKGARVALLTTAGHRDVLAMREGLKDERYNLRLGPPPPLVPRYLTLGIRERMRPGGVVETPLDQASVPTALRFLASGRIEAVAVCYLHSYANPRHEEDTAKLIRAAMPSAYVSISSEVLPQIKEYERVSTTVVNAYVGPILGRYLERLEKRLRDAGYAGGIVVMQSHGGVAGIPDAVRLAAGSVLSGPAGGIAGAVRCGTLAACPRLITFDMGGTSTDIALVSDCTAHLTADQSLAGLRIALPSIDIHTLGAGGGSIAHVDAGGLLHVGPQSAGASPGPACYGRGGRLATVTDANLVLGYLDPDNFLGGRARLDVRAAEQAVDAVAAELGSSRVDAAHGICRIVDTSMAEGISVVSVRRGVDPRGFALLAFGGAAGLHATRVARMLEMPRVIVPRVASVLSAWGMLAGDLRWDLVRTCFAPADRDIGARLAAAFAALEAEGARRAGAGDAIRFARSADMRLGEQVYEITIDLDGLSFTDEAFSTRLRERFHGRHQDLYGYSAPAREPMVVNVRLAVVGGLAAPPVEPVIARTGAAAARTARRTWQDGWVDTPVFDLDSLPADAVIQGPALFESATTTVLIRAAERARVTAHGWLDIELAGAAPP